MIDHRSPGSASQPRLETVVQGEYRISSNPDVTLSTVLGSCVAVCLFDEDAGIGGMNHYLLPEGQGTGGDAVKYGALAMELLINGLLKAGASRHRMQAKIFGGARITANFADIGARNAAFGRDFLAREGLRVVSENLGGTNARRVHFHPVSGKARLMTVPNNNRSVPTVAPPQRGPAPGDITLF